jgi:hypothetical protein
MLDVVGLRSDVWFSSDVVVFGIFHEHLVV